MRPGRFRARRGVLGVAVLLILLQAAAAVAADEMDRILVMRAADLEAQHRCEDAIAVHQGSDGTSAELGLIAGRCQLRLGDHAAAADTLEAARALPDAPAQVDLYLGVAQYHLDAFDDARASLERANARGEDGALYELYTGLLRLHASDSRGAALALERARRSDPTAVEPVASYYAWIAWRGADDEARAEAALARLRTEDPDGPWIAEAERQLSKLAPTTPYLWVNGEAGLEFDSNVTVRGSGVQRVFINGNTVSGKDDGRAVWRVDGGAGLFRSENWSGGVLAAYSGSAHFDIDEFDTHYPTAGVWLDRELGESTTLRAHYDFGYAWINYEPYMLSNVVSGSLFQRWGDDHETELKLAARVYDFRYDRVDPPSGTKSDIDQDGTAAVAELNHRYELGIGDLGWEGSDTLALRAGYRFTHYAAEGREFDYEAHRFTAGFGVTLPLEVAWDSWTAFTYQPYERTSFYASNPASDPKHRDRIWEFGTEFEKFVAENVSVLGRYRYTDSDSNTKVYDYDRHVVGAYVRVRFR